MEHHQFSFFPHFFAFLIFLYIVLKTWRKSKTSTPTPNLPPGPWKLPIIGNMHQLFGSPPHCRLRDLALTYGPVMHLQLGETSNIVISSPEAIKEVMTTHDITFSNRPFLLAASILFYNSQDIAFSSYGDYWRQLRKICVLELLSAKRVQSFRPIREEEVSSFIKLISSSVSTGSPINLSRMLISLTNCNTLRAAFGAVLKQQDAFLPVLQKMVVMIGGFTVSDFFPSIKILPVLTGMMSELKKLHRDADELLETIINEHRVRRSTVEIGFKGETHDLVDVLLDLQENMNLELPLTTDSIKAVILDIFLAGSETSSSVVEWAMSEMMKCPRVLRKAQAEVRQVFDRKEKLTEKHLHELKYLKLVIKETLRLHPPGPLLAPKQNCENVEIHGYHIPAGTKVIINAWAVARDPNHWTNPDTFCPERFLDSPVEYNGTDYKYIPFGAGRRMCPGGLYGMAFIELALASLLYHFDWKLPNGLSPEELDMCECFGAAVRRQNDLYLIPILYHPPTVPN